jgi:Family of unknown function (DUF6527)
MSSVASNLPPDRDFVEEPGDWDIRNATRDGEPRRMFWFTCPRKPGKACAVPLLPARNPNGAGWAWDGDTDAPTLTPSINCVGGCGWHGFITDGKVVGV